MKNAAFGLLATFLAIGAHGDVPTTPGQWYDPPGGYKTESSEGYVYWLNDSGKYEGVLVSVDKAGEVIGVASDTFSEGSPAYPAYLAMCEALKAETLARLNRESIETIGTNLWMLTKSDGIHIKNENTGQEFTIKFGESLGKAVSESTKEIQATSDAEDPVDWKSLGWTSEYKLELLGAHTATASKDEWWNDHSFFVPYLKDNYALGWKKYGGYYSRVFGTMQDNGRTMLTLAGWSGGNECGTNLKAILTDESDDNRRDHYVLTRFGTGSGAVFHYVPFGDRLELGNGSPVDGSSITTNTEDGASSSGVASLYGWTDADAGAVPSKKDGTLHWAALDGLSLALATVDNTDKYEVKDAHVYAGHHSRHYFGTSSDSTAALGWHELPNVTTNRVEGDNLTIASTVDSQDPGIKRLGLRGWDPSWSGDPLFLVNAGGNLWYIPLPAPTNVTECACTQKWDNAVAWIGGGAAVDEDGSLTLPDDSLDDYLYGTLGYIYSTTADGLHFDNDGENIQASFAAPENWADGSSLEMSNDVYQIKGFAAASACDASMSEMLSDPTGSDATTHLLLAKKTNSGELHYVSIGNGIQSGAAVDDTTITTNTAHGATTSGVASIYGWSGASNDTYLSKNAGGGLEWRKIILVPDLDGASIVTNAAGALTLNGYADADPGAVPQKTAQGLSWLKASSATNLILAGAGINITDNGGGAITISAQSYESGSVSGDGTTKSLTVVTDVRYDETTHKFQKKTRTLTFKGVLGSESAWTDVFEAASHKSEHEVE